MPQVGIAGETIDVNEEGYLTNSEEWTPDVAREIAKVEGIELTDKHWDVLEYLREQHAEGAKLTIRRVGKSDVVDSVKEFYDLFPDGPLKKASKIAGIPKPASCV
ncbi:sulfur relay protein DsrC [Salinibacter sp. 10B]|uniref:TusE/DsrC/DsvC family sulfur relay protein n=1 Tax=Salinibacter sp. 10B TaxID=1923971 RepID=UPI000CF3CAFC|nr:TusE/DsrC/DsvC family sulfur relay protein [Salinibacter sp. 10B]PQJ33275.1 sulfur relay protein DsrC [Salinibacter sp. 10B]